MIRRLIKFGELILLYRPTLKEIWHGSHTYQYGRYAKRRANVTPRCGTAPVP